MLLVAAVVVGGVVTVDAGIATGVGLFATIGAIAISVAAHRESVIASHEQTQELQRLLLSQKSVPAVTPPNRPHDSTSREALEEMKADDRR